MADDITLNVGSGGSKLATDEIAASGRHYQRVKLTGGLADSEEHIGGDAANGLDVDVTRLPALVAGSAKVGAVDLDSDAAPGAAPPATAQYVAGTDGTNIRGLKTDAAGELQVDVASALPAGTNNIGDVDLASPIPAGANEIGGVRLRGQRDDTAPATVAEDAYGEVRITQNRAVHANLRNDAGAELGVAAAPVRTDPTGTTAQPVTDGGGSLTIDGTVDTELPPAAALADTAANPTAPAVDARGSVFNGTTWDRARGDVANGVDVDVTRLPALVAGSAKIGAVDLDSDAAPGAAPPATAQYVAGTDGTNARGLKTDAAGELQVDVLSLPALPAGTNNVGDVDIASAPTGASAIQVQGAAAHDAVVAGNPVRMGGKANLNEPTAVADGDAVDTWHDLQGRLVVLAGHPNPEAPVTVNGSAAGLSVIATPGASLSLYICKGTVHNRGAEQVVSLRDGAAGTIRWTANLAADGGGSMFDFGSRGWKLTANTALVADIAAASVDVNVTEFYIAA